jgi:hypothetical protein
MQYAVMQHLIMQGISSKTFVQLGLMQLLVYYLLLKDFRGIFLICQI